VIGFVHFFVMLLTLTIYANLIQLSPNYARAAQDLGASRWQTFAHVILPLTLPGVVTGAFLTFVLCIGDYITPQILGGNTELTLPQLIMLQLGRSGNFPLASALSVVLMAWSRWPISPAAAGCGWTGYRPMRALLGLPHRSPMPSSSCRSRCWWPSAFRTAACPCRPSRA
jgi:ABC-type spermidine/putrescine transport system permease subunit I